MIDQLNYECRWWSWWSNPLIGLHPDREYLTQPRLKVGADLGYVDLLELRSTLQLDDLPDDWLQKRPELRSLFLADEELLLVHFRKFAALTMDASILHARPQEWEEGFGVTSPELIRELITLKSEVPGMIYSWHEALSRFVSNTLRKRLLLADRTSFGLAVYLKSFFPHFYTRWILTQPKHIAEWVKAVEPLPVELWEEVDVWTSPSVLDLHQSVMGQFDLPQFEAPQLDDDMSELDPDESWMSYTNPVTELAASPSNRQGGNRA